MLPPNGSNYTAGNLISTLKQPSPPVARWMRTAKMNKRFINCDTKLFACSVMFWLTGSNKKKTRKKGEEKNTREKEE